MQFPQVLIKPSTRAFSLQISHKAPISLNMYKNKHKFRSNEDGCPATLTILTRQQRHYDIWWQKFPLVALLGPSCEFENSEYYSLKCYYFYWKGQNKQNLCITSVRPYVIAKHEGTQEQRNEFSWNFVLEKITEKIIEFCFLENVTGQNP